MIRRLLSLFLAFVTILSLLPTAAFAASSEEDALGEVDIYNGDYELGYVRRVPGKGPIRRFTELHL